MSEIQINNSVLLIGYTDYLAAANSFLTTFSTDSSDFDAIQSEGVLYSELMDLQDNLNPELTSDYLLGLRVGYGLIEDTIKLYYMPIIGTLSDTENDIATFDLEETTGDFSTILTNGLYPVYSLESGTLVQIATDYAKNIALAAISNYQENILITHPGNNTPSPYDSNLDVKSVFFPFQEIEALYELYEEEVTRIFFTSICETLDTRNCHSLALSHIDPSSEIEFEGQAANYANMCPPNCPSVVYQIS